MADFRPIFDPSKAKEGLDAKGFLGKIRKVEWEARLRCPESRKNSKDPESGETKRNCDQAPWSPDDGTECPKCSTGGEDMKQLHVEIEPLDHQIEGATGAYHEWFTHSEQKTSKWMELMNHLLVAGVNVSKPGFTEQDLVGQELTWKRVDLKIGNFVSKDARMPFKATAAAKEAALGKGKAAATGAVKSASASTAAPKKGAASPLVKLDSELAKGMTEDQVKQFCKAAGIKKEVWNAHKTELGERLQQNGDGDEKTYMLAGGEDW